MESFFISTQSQQSYSMISNTFIDRYMAEANGDFVKVYLYLVKAVNTNQNVSIEDIADHLNYMTGDVTRALKYWADMGIMDIQYEDTRIKDICMLPLPEKQSVQIEEQSSKDAVKRIIDPHVIVPDKEIATHKQLIQAKENTEISTLIYMAETLFGRLLSQGDINSLLYMLDTLHMDISLIEYLIEYAVTRDKKSFRYMETIAIEWYRQNIKTIEEAKNAAPIYNPIFYTIRKTLGLGNRGPTQRENQYIEIWEKEYGFDMQMIDLACQRAINMKPTTFNFDYINGILLNWRNKGIRTKEAIEKADAEHQKAKKAESKNNLFANYKQSTSADLFKKFDQMLAENGTL